jgi:hypothetical protein
LTRYNIVAIIELLPPLAAALRKRGVRIGTGQLVMAARILRSYSTLVSREYLDENEVSLILSSTLLLRQSQAEALGEELRALLATARLEGSARGLREEIVERLEVLGLKPGARVFKKRVLKGPHRRERVAAYLELKRIGVIRGSPGRERVASESEIALISKRLARLGYSSVGEAARESGRGWSEDDIMLHAEARLGAGRELETMETRRLLDLGEAAIKKGDKNLLKSVAEEIGRRILRGERVDGERAYRILRRAGLLSVAHERALVARDPSLVPDTSLSLRELSKLAESLGEEKGGSIIAKALKGMKRNEARELLSSLDPSLLWDVKRHPFTGEEASLVEAAVNAARSLREALTYAETGEPGRADMARDLAVKSLEAIEKIGLSMGRLNRGEIEGMALTALSIVDFIEGGFESVEGLVSSLRRLGLPRALKVLRGLYTRASPEARGLVVRAAASLLYRLAAREGLRLLPRKILSLHGPGRLEVRHTLYRMSRLAQDPLVFRKRLRSRSLSLVLDVSGSMIEHSVWALSIAMLFNYNIERLVLFSSEPTVLDGPFSPLELAETLLSARFAGYTDIAGALEAASTSKPRRLVLVSDLHQTVKPGDPVDVASALVRRGVRMLAIAPPAHDTVTRRRLEEVGVKVRIAYTPRDAAREVLRTLLR